MYVKMRASPLFLTTAVDINMIYLIIVNLMNRGNDLVQGTSERTKSNPYRNQSVG